MPYLYLLRHGELEANPERRFIGQQEKKLSLTGQRQGLFWQQELKDLSFSKVICSDLQRCRHMADLVIAGKDVSIEIDRNFREIHLGHWEGLRKDEVEARWPGALEQRGLDFWGFQPCGGESFAMLTSRVLSALGQHLYGVGEHENVLLISHAGVNRVILLYYLALGVQNLFALPQPYAACSRLFFSLEDISCLQTYR